jgi:ketosteroid isomerase-like protein
MSNVETVQAIYGAFGRGDVPAILELMADDVEFELWPDNHAQNAGVPWFTHRRGQEGVAEFFAVIADWTVNEFTVGTIMDGGDKVAVEITFDATLPGGTPYRDDEIHLWEFDGSGKVSRLRHYVDTAKHIDAARQEIALRA